MGTWVNEHFRDVRRARETVAAGVVIAAVVGLAIVLLGLWFAR